MEGDDSLRAVELEMLQSMFVVGEELIFTFPDDPFTFTLRLEAECGGDADTPAAVELGCTLPSDYPAQPPHLSISCKELRMRQHDAMKAVLLEELAGLEEDEMRILHASEWLKEHLHEYLKDDSSSSPDGADGDGASSSKAAADGTGSSGTAGGGGAPRQCGHARRVT